MRPGKSSDNVFPTACSEAMPLADASQSFQHDDALIAVQNDDARVQSVEGVGKVIAFKLDHVSEVHRVRLSLVR